jgi:hypothetical protein
MLVYMVHPDHGVHLVYNQADLERAKLRGWTVREEKRETLTVKKARKCQSPPIPNSKLL